MKKLLLVVLAVLVVSVFAMTACSKDEPTAEPTVDAAVESVEVASPNDVVLFKLFGDITLRID